MKTSCILILVILYASAGVPAAAQGLPHDPAPSPDSLGAMLPHEGGIDSEKAFKLASEQPTDSDRVTPESSYGRNAPAATRAIKPQSWSVVSHLGEGWLSASASAECEFAVSPSERAHLDGQTTGVIEVQAPPGCAWEADSQNEWISIVQGSSGDGVGQVTYALTANLGEDRNGSLSVAGFIIALRQEGPPCEFELAPSFREHEPEGGSGGFEVLVREGCSWQAESDADWIALEQNARQAEGSGAVLYQVEPHFGPARRGTISLSFGQAFVVEQQGLECEFAVEPLSRGHLHDAESAAIEVDASDGCAWEAESRVPWITISQGARGEGRGVVVYDLAENRGEDRIASLSVAGHAVTIRQEGPPCSFALEPRGSEHPARLSQGRFQVEVREGCGWEARSDQEWILLQLASGNGSGVVSFTVQANPGEERDGIISVGDQSFSVAQQGAECRIEVAPQEISLDAERSQGVAEVFADDGCQWRVQSDSPWLRIADGAQGQGDGRFVFEAEANPGDERRAILEAVASAGSASIDVRQEGAECEFSVDPLSRGHNDSAQTAAVQVETRQGCAWTAVSDAQWLDVVEGSRGEGSGLVRYAIQANEGEDRRATLRVAGQDVSIRQEGPPCEFVLEPDSRGHTHQEAVDSIQVNVRSGCQWEASSRDDWIEILQGDQGRGSGTVLYRLAPNRGEDRQGSLVIAGRTVSIRQEGPPCDIELRPEEGSHSHREEGGGFEVLARDGCSWQAESLADWIEVEEGDGVGAGAVLYRVAENAGADRRGAIRVGDRRFSVLQEGPPECSVALSPQERGHGHEEQRSGFEVLTPEGCAWEASSDDDWIEIESARRNQGPGAVLYRLAANPEDDRIGSIQVAGERFQVRQEGPPCRFSIDPARRTHGSQGETGRIEVEAPPNCRWTAESDSSWLRVLAIEEAGLVYQVSPNPSSLQRRALISLAGHVFEVLQQGTDCRYDLAPILRRHGPAPADGEFEVDAPLDCEWAVSKDDGSDWLTLASGLSGSGPGVVSYRVEANPGPEARKAELRIAGQLAEVDQEAQGCSFSIQPVSRRHGAEAGEARFEVDAEPDCEWTVLSRSEWIEVISGQGAGTGEVRYRVLPNDQQESRQAVLEVEGQEFAVTQAPEGRRFLIPYFEGSLQTFTGLAVASSRPSMVRLTFSAFDSQGRLLDLPRNPVVHSLRSDQLSLLGQDLFGSLGGEKAEGWVELQTDHPQLGPFFLAGGGSRLDGEVAFSDEFPLLYFTRVYSGQDAYRGQPARTTLRIANPADSPILLQLTLQGRQSRSVERTVAAKGLLREEVGELFGVEAGDGDFVTVRTLSGRGAVGFSLIELPQADTTIGLNAATEFQTSRLFSAQMIASDDLYTSVGLINASPQPRRVQLRLRSEQGEPLSADRLVILAPGQSFASDVRDLLQSDAQGAATGSIEALADGAGLIGDVIFGDRKEQRFAAGLHLQGSPHREALFSQVANTPGFFTGLALLNPDSASTRVVVSVHRQSGQLAGRTELTLKPGQRISRTLAELVPASQGQAGGFVVVSSSRPVVAQQIFGTTELSLFSSVAPSQAH